MTSLSPHSADTAELARDVVASIRSVTGPGTIALHEPQFSGNELRYLKNCIDSTFVSSVGPFVDRFEAELADFTGARHAVAVVNGTAALHLSMILAGVQRDDEVLTPALSFAATANAISHAGATPHFVDSEERTLGVDPVALRAYLGVTAEKRSGVLFNRTTGRRIRAMVPMHTFGHPSDIEGLLAVARDYHLVLVEDAAESLGSTVGGRHTGTFGTLGTLSFNGNKTITTGGGGAILTNDATLGRQAKHISTTAKQPHRWEFVHDAVAYNYRMPNLNAALGCAQLEQLRAFVEAKRHLYTRYAHAFDSVSGIKLVKERSGTRSNYWLQTLLLDPAHADARDCVLGATNDAGIMTRPAWRLMHHLPHFSTCPRMPLPVAESLERRLINIPSSAALGISGREEQTP